MSLRWAASVSFVIREACEDQTVSKFEVVVGCCINYIFRVESFVLDVQQQLPVHGVFVEGSQRFLNVISLFFFCLGENSQFMSVSFLKNNQS